MISNILTILRIILVPLFIFFLYQNTLIQNIFISRLLATFIFILASLTDYFDGYFARKYKIVSKFGEFIDPLADKILILSVFISFLLIPYIKIPIEIILIILLREVIITWVRIKAILNKTVMKTSYWGKLKTVSQIVTILIILVILSVHAFIIQLKDLINVNSFSTLYQIYRSYNIPKSLIYLMKWLPYVLVYVTAFFAIYSGTRYLIKNWKTIIKFNKKNNVKDN